MERGMTVIMPRMLTIRQTTELLHCSRQQAYLLAHRGRLRLRRITQRHTLVHADSRAIPPSVEREMPVDDQLTLGQAAEILGCSIRYVKRLCQTGRLAHHKPSVRRTLVDARSLKRLIEGAGPSHIVE